MAQYRWWVAGLILGTSFASNLSLADVALHKGRYVGYLETSGAPSKIAVTLDLLTVKPNDPNLNPILVSIMRLNLGGLQSHEYVTEVFTDIRYDYHGGIISMGGEANDLTLTGQVSGDEQSKIDGSAFIRSGATAATIHLVEYSDDPDAEPGTLPSDQYQPLLSGQYVGKCEGREALLQIESVRGLDRDEVDGHRDLGFYEIVGRLGMHAAQVACPDPLFCAMRNYRHGSFDLARRRLLLDSGNGVDECRFDAGGLSCTVHLGAVTAHCQLNRQPTPIPPLRFYNRAEHLRPTAAELAPVPDPNPPSNRDMVAALTGDFVGYLHHETTDRYQAMRLNVMAFTSTNNPHNLNIVYITGVSALYFGRSVGDEVFVQQFEPRTFYLVPGFTLESPAADTFLQVQEWRLGFVRGVAYSRAFGRVGTFELARAQPAGAFPPIGAGAKFVPAIGGPYHGPLDGPEIGTWNFDVLVPTQRPGPKTNTLAFEGNFIMKSGAFPRQAIKAGAYDFFTGSVAWESADGRAVTGTVAPQSRWQLFWSGAAIWSVIMNPDHGLHTYERR